jgi:hypothetical protein
MDEESWNEDEYYEEFETDDEESTMPCPYCKRQIHEDSVRCPYCENYISEEDAPPARKPWWIYIGAVVVLYIVYHWVVGW